MIDPHQEPIFYIGNNDFMLAHLQTWKDAASGSISGCRYRICVDESENALNRSSLGDAGVSCPDVYSLV